MSRRLVVTGDMQHAPTEGAAPAFSLGVVFEGRDRVIKLGGELDLATRDEFFVVSTEGNYPSVVIDISALTFMDCSGYGGLMASRSVIEQSGGTFTIRGHAGQPARLLDRIARLEGAR